MKAPRTVRGSYVLVPEQDGDEVSVELPDKLISEAQIPTIDPSKLCTEVLVSICYIFWGFKIFWRQNFQIISRHFLIKIWQIDLFSLQPERVFRHKVFPIQDLWVWLYPSGRSLSSGNECRVYLLVHFEPLKKSSKHTAHSCKSDNFFIFGAKKFRRIWTRHDRIDRRRNYWVEGNGDVANLKWLNISGFSNSARELRLLCQLWSSSACSRRLHCAYHDPRWLLIGCWANFAGWRLGHFWRENWFDHWSQRKVKNSQNCGLNDVIRCRKHPNYGQNNDA